MLGIDGSRSQAISPPLPVAMTGAVISSGPSVQPLHCANINAAVALALPTTPGIPAPGCVPAPTK